MAQVEAIEELYTDGITAAGATRRISFHMRVRLVGGEQEWHYYGTPLPAGVVGTQHAEVLFPPDFLNLPNASDTLYSLALETALFKTFGETVG